MKSLWVLVLVVTVGFISCQQDQDKFAIKKQEKAASGIPEITAAADTSETGLIVQIIEEGQGESAQMGDTVKVHYTGWLTNGKQFDSSIPRKKPLDLTLGAGSVIQGWEEGIVGMRVGEKRRLTIPPYLGYGEEGYSPVIPPNATLIFDVELLSKK